MIYVIYRTFSIVYGLPSILNYTESFDFNLFTHKGQRQLNLCGQYIIYI